MAFTKKPVISIKIEDEIFHGADEGNLSKFKPILTSFEYEDNDGTAKTNKSEKGKRDVLKFSFNNLKPDKQTFWSDDPLLKNGNLVEVQFGFSGELLSPKIQMVIYEITTEFPATGPETVTVTCHDRSKTMNNKVRDITRPRKKLEKNEDVQYPLSDVVKEIAEENELIIGEESISPEFDEILLNGWQQKKKTDAQFLKELAKNYGADFYVENRIVFFVNKSKVTKGNAWGFLHRGFGADQVDTIIGNGEDVKVAQMISFSPKINFEFATNKVQSIDLCSKSFTEIEDKAEETKYTTLNAGGAGKKELSSSDTPDTIAVKETTVSKTNFVPRTLSEAKFRTGAKQQQDAESAVTADATTIGDPRLTAKILVITTGRVSEKYLGVIWYVESCKHIIKATSTGPAYMCKLSMTAPAQLTADGTPNKANKVVRPWERYQKVSIKEGAKTLVKNVFSGTSKTTKPTLKSTQKQVKGADGGTTEEDN